ncbi:MAG: hypothetical protein CM1200mP35_10610 [Chloroflexota bacterium]|nr:MAG: hypothetical protein CM1200mP35_10610 [Chloroflexota bacterium]
MTVEVLGLIESSLACIKRFADIPPVRTPINATIIHRVACQPGQPSAASIMAMKANGVAKRASQMRIELK